MGATKRTVASKHKLGNGWVVLTYDPYYDAWVESHPMSYHAANNALREARETWNTKTQSYEQP